MSSVQPVDADLEGFYTVKKTWELFYDPRQHTFINSNKSEGSYDASGKYTVWPIAVYLQAIVDCARVYPEQTASLLQPAFTVLDKYLYKNKRYYGAYCASEYFDGNTDIYYDDNAQIASALVTAYEVTHQKWYLDRAVDNVKFLMTGFLAEEPGGVRWHVDKKGSNACTTAECGLAALRVARLITAGPLKDEMFRFASGCCLWIFERLQDPKDYLICDGLEPQTSQDGSGRVVYQRNANKWTYNQGTALSLSSMLFSLTNSEWYRQRAQQLASSVSNRYTCMFDNSTRDIRVRYYHDSVYFYQLLAEGFADFVEHFDGVAPGWLVDQVKTESLRNMKYLYMYLRDPEDGLYFQTFELFKINKRTFAEYQRLVGGTRTYDPTAGEREHTKDIPVEQRRMTKSLIACGGAARIFFQGARLHRTFLPN